MEKITVTVSLDEERLEALEMYLKKDGSTVQKKLDEGLRTLYGQTVPEAVQEYLECKAAARSKRPLPSKDSKTAAAAKSAKAGG